VKGQAVYVAAEAGTAKRKKELIVSERGGRRTAKGKTRSRWTRRDAQNLNFDRRSFAIVINHAWAAFPMTRIADSRKENEEGRPSGNRRGRVFAT